MKNITRKCVAVFLGIGVMLGLQMGMTACEWNREAEVIEEGIEKSGNIKLLESHGFFDKGNNECAIGLNFGAEENLGVTIENGVLTIPAAIEGYTVTEILEGYDDWQNEKDAIVAVEIPSTVKVIRSYAFAGMSNLTTITFTERNNIEEIGEYAFSGCEKLTSFTIGRKVENLFHTLFEGCSSLERIEVEKNSEFYTSVDGAVYSKSKATLLYYPAGRKTESYRLEDGCDSIAPNAICGNAYLKTLDLNETTIINQHGIADCAALEEITADHLDIVYDNVFTGTKWLEENTNDFVSLNKVLIQYRGKESVVTVSGYKSIAPYAFADNSVLTKVILSGNDLIGIGDGVFYHCENLANVEIQTINQMVFIGQKTFDGCAENLTITVPQMLLEQYKANALWQVYDQYL